MFAGIGRKIDPMASAESNAVATPPNHLNFVFHDPVDSLGGCEGVLGSSLGGIGTGSGCFGGGTGSG